MNYSPYLVLSGERVRLSLPRPEAAVHAARYYRDNQQHLAHWLPPLPGDFYTEPFWQRQLARQRDEYRAGYALRTFLSLIGQAHEPLIGTCNFTRIVRGPVQSCHIGFSLAAKRQGCGLMSEALRVAIAHVFDVLRLHRLQACHDPDNERSRRVLDRLGFVQEGYARELLFIDGAWRDQVLMSLTNPDPEAARPRQAELSPHDFTATSPLK